MPRVNSGSKKGARQMDSGEVKAICDERLGRWTDRLVGEHSTPVLLVGVGHDHKNGSLVLCTLEDMSDIELLLFLRGAVHKLGAQIIRGL